MTIGELIDFIASYDMDTEIKINLDSWCSSVDIKTVKKIKTFTEDHLEIISDRCHT